MDSPKTNEVYEHYKGDKYQVVTLGKHTETGEDMVVYRALYGDGNIWIRPREMFLSEVEIDGKMRPRFLLLEDVPNWLLRVVGAR